MFSPSFALFSSFLEYYKVSPRAYAMVISTCLHKKSAISVSRMQMFS